MAGVLLPGLRYIVNGKGGLLNWFVKSPWKTIELIKHVRCSFQSISFAFLLHLSDFFGPELFFTFCRLLFSLYPCVFIAFQVDAPILFLSGLLDEMVPPSHMRELYDAAQDTSSARHTLVEFPDGTHMETWSQGGDRYWRSIEIFVQNCAADTRSLSTSSIDT